MPLSILQLYSPNLAKDDGHVKFQTFRALALGGVFLVGGLGLFGLYASCHSDDSKAAATATADDATSTRSTQARPPPKAPATGSPGTTSAPTGDPSEVTSLHKQVLDRMAAGFPGDKVKDAVKTDAVKVNLYKDPDGTRRAKLDLDRDDKWDEKWTFEGASGVDAVKRQVSTKDDDSTYDVEYRLQAGRWVLKTN